MIPTLRVVGAGLIGSSVALAARAAGWAVTIADVDPAVLAAARARGFHSAEGGNEPHLVIVAVPPQMAALVVADQLKLNPNSTVSDVTSVKAALLRDIELLSPRFVPGHPLAGREVSGPGAAHGDLFRDRPWVLTPHERSDPERVVHVSEFVTSLGAVVVSMDPAEHDEVVAATSHVPQLMASVLAASLLDVRGDVRVSGQGLRDQTRLATSDAGLWQQILAANAGPVREALERIIRDLSATAMALSELEILDSGNRSQAESLEVLRDVFERGNAGRARVPARHGYGPESLTSMVVSVADSPGELARLFGDIGHAELNLEDVRIEHALGRPTGRVEVVVGAQFLEALRHALTSAGWSASDSGS